MKIKIAARSFSRDNVELPSILADAYVNRVRPFCLCTKDGVAMYIAKINGSFHLKRMPNSGSSHSAECASYEPPPEVSGFAEVAGRAVQEDSATGETVLKLDFALSKTGKRGPNAEGSASEETSAKSDGNKLSMRGLAHYLWSEAGFNRWSPRMSGKRNWSVIRKYLYEAAAGKNSKGNALLRQLYIPETFSVDRKDAIESNRRKSFHEVFGSTSGKTKPLMLVLGEVKEMASNALGHRITIKHVPDLVFMLADDIAKRVTKTYTDEIQRRAARADSHLIVFGTFERSDSGVLWFHEIVLINLTNEWIPFESMDEHLLLDELCRSKRRFIKSLRFNLPKLRPLSSVVLTDTGAVSTALYVVPDTANDDYLQGVSELVEGSELQSWIWLSAVDSMPALPAVSSGEQP